MAHVSVIGGIEPGIGSLAGIGSLVCALLLLIRE
jgi:hypothetical protein